MSRLWQKNDSERVNRDWFFEFTAGEDRKYDSILIPYDIKCNLAQVKMLEKSGILDASESRELTTRLKILFAEWSKGNFDLDEADEDVHSAIENYLTAKCGDSGKKIHTGRSRNDQVLTDMRLYAKDQILEVANLWLKIIYSLGKLIDEYPSCYFAGYTHTQAAMPTSVDAWCAGYIDILLGDLRGLIAVYAEVDRSPLGSAAGFGVPYLENDREMSSDLLGFAGVQHAVTAVQLSRGVLEKKIMDALGYAAYGFNRLASDVILFTSPVLGTIKLSEDQTSGSSIMPQKRNPDAWELIRSGYSELVGLSTQLSITGTNLISGYHRDLQLTKKCLIEGFSRSVKLANAANMCLSGIQFDRTKCHNTLTNEIFATHEANKAVAGGMPFREAYRLAASKSQSSEIPDRQSLSESYSIMGYPGVYNKKMFEKDLFNAVEWLNGEQKKLKQVHDNLIKN